MACRIFALGFALAVLAGTATQATEGSDPRSPNETDACFRKAWMAAAEPSGPGMVLMPGKALKGFLAACEGKVGASAGKYANVRDFDDEDMIPTLVEPAAKAPGLIIK